MAKKTYKCNALSISSIKQLQKDLKEYKSGLKEKCEQLVKELAEVGIETGQKNVGSFGKYITFSMKIENTINGCRAIMYASETGKIISQWKTKDGIKSADVSPLLMVEFGSGTKAENPMEVEGVGQGTFPDQKHAFDKEGWYYMDLSGVWHHSYGITPKQPMYKAYKQMEEEIIDKAKDIFGK